ncbi:WD40 repeat-like protein [Lentithecium fluviatile CBS 122367]|uniref:WD40 repeat-containing protein SMU1 n=1 Tax=Lentithecium fluviatile CBS 122367 TaxID=1168545 RepID=A0A6G1JJ83_9PLEO|nr:WD40 repeat-like protein [Lentithecium fluviatile CBS 122367]
MFRWYRDSTRCYVYLQDVTRLPLSADEERSPSLWVSNFRNSKWFTRGWTLQELLAPSSVEFFSREGKRLGGKSALIQQIHEITVIPEAYSLLGIFDVHIPPIYGEGTESAFRRLRKEIGKLEKCMQDLRLTDPRDDKKRIEETKGGLLEDSYRWILGKSDFQQWRDDKQSRLLWIKGDPGKGKTMLLCGIIDELNKSMSKKDQLSYFFCQATDSRINSATAVLRGLLYLLVNHQPSLVLHIRKKHDHAGKALFEDANAWVALSDIFTDILQDPSLNSTFLVIDALDECATDLSKLLDFIVQKSCVSSRVKWIVSSRNWPDIEERLESAGHKVRLCLELNADSVSTAVGIFIRHKVFQLAEKKKHDDKTRDAVLNYLSVHANDTFLWVALVCQNLEKIPRWNTLAKLNAFPPGLDSFYKRMTEQICKSDNADLCKQILASAAIVYRPITLVEITSLVEVLENMADDLESLREIIGLCGSFLTIRGDAVYFVHQSAKDFLFTKVFNEIFPSGTEEGPLRNLLEPDPDPLAASCYSCIYWIDHLCDWNPSFSAKYNIDLQDEGAVDGFLRQQYLYWLEALSLCKSMSKVVVSMAKLNTLIEVIYESTILSLLPDCYLIACSLLCQSVAFSHDSTRLASASDDETVKIWDASSGECLQTLESHRSYVRAVAFSHNSTRLASASYDKTVKIWDASSGECLQTLEAYYEPVQSVAFSHDSTQLASASYKTVKIWDVSSGECLQTLEGHRGYVRSVAFSHDSTRLALVSYDKTVKIWDASSGECLQTLEGHRSSVRSVAFSHDSTRLASASYDKTVKIWDASSGECLQVLEGHRDPVQSVAFSHDSTRLASASDDETVKIWDVSSVECLQTLEVHRGYVQSVAFSYDSTRLASASYDRTVKIWDASSGECLQTLEGHRSSVQSVAFSHDSTRLASASYDKTVKIWDASSGAYLQTLTGHSGSVSSVAFTYDSTRVASASDDKTVKIWDASSGACLQTLTIGKTLSRISFDITNSYLYTEIGTIDISSLPGSVTLPTLSEPCSPQYQGLALSADGVWIMNNFENLVWLPSEYRPSCSAMSGATICIGVGSGRVWICKVTPNGS